VSEPRIEPDANSMLGAALLVRGDTEIDGGAAAAATEDAFELVTGAGWAELVDTARARWVELDPAARWTGAGGVAATPDAALIADTGAGVVDVPVSPSLMMAIVVLVGVELALGWQPEESVRAVTDVSVPVEVSVAVDVAVAVSVPVEVSVTVGVTQTATSRRAAWCERAPTGSITMKKPRKPATAIEASAP
jgi:hypothetical protein